MAKSFFNLEILYMAGYDAHFERMVEKGEKDKLVYYTDHSNSVSARETEDQLLINLSISEILHNMSKTFVDILSDLTKTGGKNRGISDIVMIFFQGDRMIYVGLLVVLIAFMMYLVDL